MTIVKDQFGIKFLNAAGLKHRPAEPTAVLITAAEHAEGVATFTTATPHGLQVGSVVVISGFGDNVEGTGTYMGRTVVTSTPTPTTFTRELDGGEPDEPAIETTVVVDEASYGPAELITEYDVFQPGKTYALGDVVLSIELDGRFQHVCTTSGTAGPNYAFALDVDGETWTGDAVFTAQEFEGDAFWYRNGILHREPRIVNSAYQSAPAVILHSEELRYFENGKLHRIDGPAVMPNANAAASLCQYFLDGIEVSLSTLSRYKKFIVVNSPSIALGLDFPELSNGDDT